mgnify:CR=1 FL=1
MPPTTNTESEQEPSKPVTITKPTVNTVSTPKAEIPETNSNPRGNVQKGILYKVQIKTSTKLLAKTDKAYKIMDYLKYEKANGIYKYAYGPFDNYEEALLLKIILSAA